MNIKVHTEPFHYIEIEGLYTQEEYDKMFEEISFHESKNIFKNRDTEDEMESAKSGDGEVLAQNTAFWWDSLYSDREYSDILKINRKIFNFLKSEKVKESWFFNNPFCNYDNTLISYYENTDYYKPHTDIALITTLTWFYKEPKKFTGGDLVFTDYNIRFKCDMNHTIIFPSNIKHEVEKINLPKEHCGKGYGRFSMTQFLSQTL